MYLSQNNASKNNINTDTSSTTNFQLVLETAFVWEIAAMNFQLKL